MPHHQRGLSLIELMVALVIGLIFSLAVLTVQSSLTRQNVQMSDVMQRDTQTRAALDLIGADLSNAGYMLDGVQTPCAILLAYDSTVGNAPFAQYPVSAASQPLALPTSTAQGSANYPTNNPSPNAYGSAQQFTDMVFITSATSALQAPGGNNLSAYVVQNSTTQAANGQGALNSGVLPLGSTSGLHVGDTAMLRMNLNGHQACFRVPIANIGPSTAPPSTYIGSKTSALFPNTAYAAFNDPLIQAGLLPAGGSLTNADFIQSRLTDLGASGSSTLQTVVYYIAPYANAGGGSYPMLMRAMLDAQSDALLAPPEPVAAGVVSLQALFGVDETNTGNVTNYLTWPAVVSGGFTSHVRSVLFALVTKSLQSDPSYSAPATIALPNPAQGPGQFTAYTVPAPYSHNHFSVIESEVAMRNHLWTH
ncbi:MAG: PilW family protein [Thiomonas sp.]|nr:PilW family protein [Thiomonas sp.]